MTSKVETLKAQVSSLLGPIISEPSHYGRPFHILLYLKYQPEEFLSSNTESLWIRCSRFVGMASSSGSRSHSKPNTEYQISGNPKKPYSDVLFFPCSLVDARMLSFGVCLNSYRKVVISPRQSCLISKDAK